MPVTGPVEKVEIEVVSSDRSIRPRPEVVPAEPAMPDYQPK